MWALSEKKQQNDLTQIIGELCAYKLSHSFSGSLTVREFLSISLPHIK